MNWRPGDRFMFCRGVTVTGAGKGEHNWLLGSCGTIVATTSQHAGFYTVQADLKPYLKDDGWGGWAVHPSWLAPIGGSDQATSWDECIFKPRDQLVAG